MLARCSIRTLALALVSAVVALTPPPLPGQAIYGTLRGTVTDSLGPAINARVTLSGTAFTTVTDLDGRFVMHHLPAGVYVVRAEEAGRTPGEVEHVVVRSGATATVAVRIGVRSAAAAEGVPPGDLASGTRFSGDELAALPIDDSRQALGLAAGAVMRGTDIGIGAGPDVSIDGSGADQTAVFVDGAPARFETLGRSQLALGFAGISELSVLRGVAPASAAEARAAGISYVTPSGGSTLSAGLSGATDGLFSLRSTVGLNRFEGYAGGPLPGVRSLSWYVSGALYGQSSPYRGAGADTVPSFALAGIDSVVSYPDFSGNSYTVAVPRFAQVSGSCGSTGGDSSAVARAIRDNYGLRCQGLRLSLAWTTSRRAQAKLLYSYGDGSSLSLTGLASDFQQRDWPGQDLADNLAFTGTRTHSAMLVLNWAQRLPALAGGALALTGNLSLASDGYESGPLDLASEADTRDPALGIELSMLRFAGLEGLSFPLSDAVVQQMRAGRFQPPYFQRYDLLARQGFRFNPYGVSTGFPTGGLTGDVTVASETRLDGRLGAEWRAQPWLGVEAGADFSRTDLSYYDAALIVTLEPNAFTAKPRRTGAYASARVTGAGLTLEGGVRFDRYQTGADFPIFPGRIWSSPARGTDTVYASWISKVMAPGRTQSFLTPHLRMQFRVDTSTVAWVGFGQEVEVPPYAMLFANANTDLGFLTSGQAYGRDLSYATSTTIQGGLGHLVASHVSIDASVWSKSAVQPYRFQSVNVYDPAIGGDPTQTNETLDLLTSTADSRALGGQVRLAWGAARPWSGSLWYAIEQLHPGQPIQSGPIPLSLPDVTTQAVAATVVARVPDGWRRGSALGTAASGLSAALTGRGTSGAGYTAPFLGTGLAATAPASGIQPLLPLQYTPWTWHLDLRLAKSIATGRTRWTVYAEARNLLDLRNLVALFATTGTDQNPQLAATWPQQQITSLQIDAGALWQYRQVMVNGVTQNQTGVNLSDCSQYPVGQGGVRGVPDCLALRQVEARWGNGDQFYDLTEINRALSAWYDSNYGTWRFHGPARTARVGLQIEF